MIVAVVQARVTSSRLPGKALLPVAGFPAAVLAARRAANRGLNVQVATSDQSADDPLVAILRQHGIVVARGPLDDVLKRFVIATRDLPESATVVRLTADNLFPDGAFVAELADALERGGNSYLGTNSPADGLPFGLSAEAFTVSVLREADRQATSVYDREHVTPWLRRQFPKALFRPRELARDLGHLRCTMDCIDDYGRVAQVFASVADPVAAPWQQLCEVLEQSLPGPRIARRPAGSGRAGELVLGTAQLGLPAYGRANVIGRPQRAVAVELVRTAIRHGVDCLDTARAYEQAESVVGEAIKPFGDRIEIVTKLSPLADLPTEATSGQVCAAVDASVYRSCRELGVAVLPVLLLHRWNHRTSHREMIWRRLLELKDEGVIGKLGASVYAPEEAAAALEDEQIQHLQVPFNLLDHRWVAGGIDQLAAQRPEVVIHARSVLLQGILGAGPEVWPRLEGMDAAKVVERLENLVRALGRANRVDLCLAFARAQAWIHSLVLGVDSMAQLTDLLALFQRPPLDADARERVRRELPAVPETLLNPALWPAK